jgi:GST-like protein
LRGFYEAGDLVGLAQYPQVMQALDLFLTRPAVVKGIDIPMRT